MLVSYLGSALVTAATLGLTKVLEPWLAGTVLPPLLAAAMAIALVRGRGPGLFSVALGAAGLKFAFLPPLYSFAAISVSSAVRLFLYVALAVPVVWLAGFVCEAYGAARTAHAKAVLAIRQREDILAIVSHDLRTPLSTLLLQLELLVASGHKVDDHGQRLLIERVRRQGKTMNRLIGDLLDFASIDAGALVVEKRPVALVEIMGEISERFEPSARKKGIKIEVVDPPPIELLCDTDRILQVFSNLIGNAIKFSSDGGVIAVHARQTANALRVEIRDHGKGIATEELESVFNRYWKSDRHDRRGAGLGLAIAKGIIRAHGGDIGVLASSPGEGTTMFFEIPLNADAEASQSTPCAAARTLPA